MITWVMRRGQIKHLLYEMCLTGRIDRETFCEQIADLNKVTPVVLCKDCKYWRRFAKEDANGGCSLLEINEGREPNDYCSKAERKDEVEE